ncbi:MAG: hypothetical protein IPI11_14780 [Haliscomenobacter sp.]|nr:hypothetical protein [Haliscomenobacter sp.]
MKIVKACIVLSSILFLLLSLRKYDFGRPERHGQKPVYLPLSELGNIRNLPAARRASGNDLPSIPFFMLEKRKASMYLILKIPQSRIASPFSASPLSPILRFQVTGCMQIAGKTWSPWILSDLMRIRVFSRKTDVLLPLVSSSLYNGIFECVDPEKGAVVGWVDAPLEHVRCQTVN